MPQDLKKVLASVAAEITAQVEAAPEEEREALRTSLLDEVKDSLPDLYETIQTNVARGAREREEKKTQRVQKKLEAMQTELAELQEKLAEAEKAKPDVAALTAKLEAKVQKAMEAAAEKDRLHASYVREHTLKDAVSGLEASLVSAGMRPRVAKGEVARLRAEGFIRLGEEGEVEYFQLGKKDLPYAVNGDDGWSSMAKDILRSAEPQDMVSRVGPGGGTGRPGGGAPQPPGGGAPGPGRFTEPTEVKILNERTGEEQVFQMSPEFIEDKRQQMGLPRRVTQPSG